MSQFLTLVYPIHDNQVLLGYKKVGFGMGRWNGFGGKLQGAEGFEAAAKRELLEECGLEATKLEEVASLFLTYEATHEQLEVRVYLTTEFIGDIQESNEMKPQWFAINELPLAEMWPNDEHWLPLALERKKLKGTFVFEDYAKLKTWEVIELKSIEPVLGIYEHYRGNRYRLLGVATHSETMEPMAVYQSLADESVWYTRPYAMFIEQIFLDGQMIPRFRFIE